MVTVSIPEGSFTRISSFKKRQNKDRRHNNIKSVGNLLNCNLQKIWNTYMGFRGLHVYDIYIVKN